MTRISEMSAKMGELHALMMDRKLDVLDLELEELDVSEMSPDMMVCYIRTTYVVKSKLANWESFRDRVKEELDFRNSFSAENKLNTRTILHGLYD